MWWERGSVNKKAKALEILQNFDTAPRQAPLGSKAAAMQGGTCESSRTVVDTEKTAAYCQDTTTRWANRGEDNAGCRYCKEDWEHTANSITETVSVQEMTIDNSGLTTRSCAIGTAVVRSAAFAGCVLHKGKMMCGKKDV